MKHTARIRVLFMAAFILVGAGVTSSEMSATKPSVKSIEKTVAMLGVEPAGFGRPIGDRAAWAKLAKHRSYAQAVKRAGRLLKQPLPDQPDDLYLDFSRTGNRTRWQKVAGSRRGRVRRFTLAECLENKGRFLPALEKTVAALCEERTWVMAAHDRSLVNFKGTRIDVDLGSAMLAWELATADYLLGDKLSGKTRKLIRDNIRRRIFEPYLAMVAGRRKKNWWMTTTNNWNAVCLAGVTGSALTIIGPRDRRARFVEAAQKYSRNFLKGFTADGYCSEGVGYWGYGFGHYVMLAEAVYQATGGRIDMMDANQVRAPATYPWRIQIGNRVYPAFADCGVTARPSQRVMHFVQRRYGWGGDPADDRSMVSPSGNLYESMMYSFANSATRAPRAARKAKALEAHLRSWFNEAGVLICRPGEGSACRLGAAMKGGHNAEHHNHNDVGSYVVAAGIRPVLLDPGAEVYTARTFGRRRYDSKVLNSFGHPVPRVAGQLQRAGPDARARVVRKSFTDKADTLVLDIRAAYKVPDLKKLQRTFVYSREGMGSLTVTDEVEFSEPKEFETALITLGGFKKRSAGSLVVYFISEAVRVDVEASGEFDIKAEKIKEDVKTRSLPTRIAITLKEPARKASITVKITSTVFPTEPAGGAKGKK